MSPDDSEIAFSYFYKGVSRLCIGRVNGDSATTLLSAVADTIYARPKFSADGNRILFLASPRDGKNSNVFMVDKRGRNRQRITLQNKIINEAVFSIDGENVFYTKAEVNKNYSPLAGAAPHGMDVYRFSLKTQQEQRITNIHAYTIDALSTVAGGKYLLVRLVAKERRGMFLIDIKGNGLKQIVPANKPRAEVADLYDDPAYFALTNKLIFTAPYEIYSMDMKTKHAQLLYSAGANVSNVIAFNKQEKILFVVGQGGTHYRTINLDGTNGTRHEPQISTAGNGF